MQSIDNSIIKTLCYADIFDFPLTADEIHQRLITDKKVSLEIIKKRLYQLRRQGLINQTTSLYFLLGRDHIVNKRRAHTQYSAQKLITASNIAGKLSKVPYVKAIFLTGATAVGNATRQDDLDIMIVTAPNSLWTCRFFAVLWLELKGLRRRPNSKHNAGKICLNLLLTQKNLSVPSPKRNLYTAHEVIQTKPLYDPYHYWTTFRRANDWVHRFLPNSSFPISTPNDDIDGGHAPLIVEKLLRSLQQLYMLPRRSREIITPQSAYFHPRNTSRLVLAKLAKKLKQYT